MDIVEIRKDKKKYLPLLLMADEQESMIDRYLQRGIMYALYDGGDVRTVCVVTDEGGGVLEIKNIATVPEHRRAGCGRAMIDFVIRKYREEYSVLQVGTGESPETLDFYKKCGFCPSHRVENFFTDNYDHPIYEGGVKLRDMVYLKIDLQEEKENA